MNQFKVGDKVRRTSYSDSLKVGGIYTVSDVSGSFIGLEADPICGYTAPYRFDCFELVSDSSETSDKSESDIVKAWFDKVKYVTRDFPWYLDQNLILSDMGGGIWIGKETVDVIISVYDQQKAQEDAHNKQLLIDKKKALEVELAEINKQLGESV
jgi:hypothetical protein